MKYNKLTQPLNRQNPFLEETLQHIEKGEKTLLFGQKDRDLLIDSDGQVKGHSLFARKMTVDKAKFMKVFMTGLINWFDLSKASIKVFAYVANQVVPNKDTFIFDLEDCKAFTSYSGRNTITSALAELVDNQFIARGPNPYIYYINPTVFFNGDRLTFIEQYEVEATERQREPELNHHDLISSFEMQSA